MMTSAQLRPGTGGNLADEYDVRAGRDHAVAQRESLPEQAAGQVPFPSSRLTPFPLAGTQRHGPPILCWVDSMRFRGRLTHGTQAAVLAAFRSRPTNCLFAQPA